MENSLTKIIVKVGKQSKVKLSRCKAFRAIVAEDLERLTNKYTDCNIVIIENISEEENDTVKQFITNFVSKSEEHSVLFFIADENDEVTSGLADELDYNIYFTLNDICEAIRVKYGVNVGASIADRKQVACKDEDIPDLFENLAAVEQKDIDNDITSELEQITDTTPEEFEAITQARQEELERSSSYEEKDTSETSDLFEVPEFNMEETSSETETAGTESSEESTETFEESEESFDESVEKPAEPPQSSGTTNVEFEAYKEYAQEEIEKLKTKLKDANYDYNVLLKDVKGANTRIVQLEELVTTITDEKQSLQSRFDELLADETVLEDPISLSEYSELQEQIKEKTNTIEKLEQLAQSLKEQLEECKEAVGLKDIEISNLTDTIEKLNESITSGEVNKDKLDEYQQEVDRYKASADALRQEKDKLSDKLTSMGELNQEIQNESESLKQKISLEVDYRKECISLIQLAFTKVMEVSKSLELANKEISKLQKDLNKCNRTIEELRSQNDILNGEATQFKDTIKVKESSIEKLEDAMKASDDFLDEKLKELQTVTKDKENLEQELTESKNTLSSVKTQLATVQAQLKQKEDQYSILMTQSQKKSTVTLEKDAGTDNAVVEANAQLDQMNKSLMEQLSVVNKELNSQKAAKEKLEAELASCREQLGNAAQMGSMSTGSNNTVNIIRYNGPARILSVCSSGSFGATTLAMSILSRISPTAKVLYMDFDMVAPNADAWFSRTPFCSGVPNIERDVKASALGIFYEKGIDTLSKHIDRIVPNIEKTKGGCVDYFSGVYYRVQQNKVADADYTALFNLLGSMYEYIIIDLGRLGNSELNDSVIKAISEITFKNIVVTTPDRFEVRNFNLKIKANNLNTSKIAWLLNMCTTNQIDQPVQKVVQAFKFGQIFEDQALRGTREKFTRDRQNRDRLDAFINSALFSR